MDQANEQSVVDTAAEQPKETQTEEQTTEQEQPHETQGANSDTSNEDTAIDYSKLGSMSQDEQFAALSKAGVFGDGKPAEKPQNKPQQTENTEHEQTDGQAEKAPQGANEPEYEVVVDGQKVKVKQSELVNGYQRQADYTKKTQELADQRRQVDAMMAALKVNQQTNPQTPEKDKPANSVQADYQKAVAQAEKELGIKPGEFNQFDGQHIFALQQVTSRINSQQAVQQTERAQVQADINNFVAEAQKDPLTPKIDASFNQYALKLGTESPEGAKQCMAIMQARDRFLSNKATPADTKVLRAHWEYVKKALSTPEKTTASAVSKPEPPKTETPGQSSSRQSKPNLDYSKLGHMNQQQQLAALRKTGYI